MLPFAVLVPFKILWICMTWLSGDISSSLTFHEFGFMKGKGTTDAIFMARQMQENFRVKGKKLYFVVDLEKAFDSAKRSDKLGNA